MRPLSGAGETLRIADQKGRVALGRRYAGKRFLIHEKPGGETVLTPVQLVAGTERPFSSERLVASFDALENLPENWDRRGSKAPEHVTINAAREALALFHGYSLARNIRWTDPHVGANERGEVSLEWWNDARALTLYVRELGRVDFLKSWGSDISTEMEDGVISHPSDFTALAIWLYDAS